MAFVPRSDMKRTLSKVNKMGTFPQGPLMEVTVPVREG